MGSGWGVCSSCMGQSHLLAQPTLTEILPPCRLPSSPASRPSMCSPLPPHRHTPPYRRPDLQRMPNPGISGLSRPLDCPLHPCTRRTTHHPPLPTRAHGSGASALCFPPPPALSRRSRSAHVCKRGRRARKSAGGRAGSRSCGGRGGIGESRTSNIQKASIFRM